MKNAAHLQSVKPHLAAPPDAVGRYQDVLDIEAATPTFQASASSTYQLLQQGAQLAPEAPALSFFLRAQDYTKPITWTQRQRMACITQAANMLRKLGVQRGDVVAFVLPNLPETHWTIWGAEAAGIVFAINPLLEPAMMADLLKVAQPKLIVTLAPTPGSDLWEKVSGIVENVPTLQGVLAISPLHHLQSPLAPMLRWLSQLKTPKRIGQIPVLDFHKLLNAAPKDSLKFDAPQLDDVASYFCTGGTTGMPKIAVRTHRTEVANALQLATIFGESIKGPGISVFCGLPLFHVNAQIGTGLTPWSSGAHVILGTPQGYRSPGLIASFWDIAARYRFVSFSGVPTVYSALLQFPRQQQDVSQLRFGICGAAPMPVELFNRFQQETGIKILEGYGLTEGGCVSSVNPPDGDAKVGSIGLRMPWQDMRAVVLDASGQYVRDAEVNETGTIAITGPNLFKGYLNPAHNQGLWISHPDGRPWLNTGDLGRVDANGYFWLTGRSKELIIRGGHNIDPKLIEEAMHAHPAVALAAAIGRPDPHAGEVPVVYVQLRPGTEADEALLLAHAQATVSERAAWPRFIRIIDVMPTTVIGKIYKPELSKREIESVFKDEAAICKVNVTHCQARQDAKLGLVLEWSATGDPAALGAKLGRYTFRQQQL